MITDHTERMRRTLTGREITITISHGDEQRLRMYVDRLNLVLRHYPNADPLDPDDDVDLGGAILECLDAGLYADEAEYGLRAFPWGDVVSCELYEEMERRGDL